MQLLRAVSSRHNTPVACLMDIDYSRRLPRLLLSRGGYGRCIFIVYAPRHIASMSKCCAPLLLVIHSIIIIRVIYYTFYISLADDALYFASIRSLLALQFTRRFCIWFDLAAISAGRMILRFLDEQRDFAALPDMLFAENIR